MRRIVLGTLGMPGLLMAIACTDDPTTVDSTRGPSLLPVAATATPTRVVLTPTESLFVGPIGGTASLVGRAFDASGAGIPGVTLKFWEKSTSFDVVGGWYHTTGGDGSVTVQVKALAVGVKRLILAPNTGTATRDSVWVKVMNTAPPPPPPPPGPTLSAIGVTPVAVALDTGASHQFAAVDTLSDGSTKTFAGTWSATGGTVTSGGLYQAGAGPGSYRVIAAEGGQADTAAVTINPPPPGPPPPPSPLPPTALGCPTGGYLRLVSVSTDAELSSALSAALPGDQIRIAAGTYSGARSLSRSGTATDPLVVCGVAGSAPILKGGTFSSTATYLTITGLIFEGAATQDSVNIVSLNQTHDVLFSGNEIRGGHHHAGLSVKDMYNVKVTHNYIHDNGHDTSHDHGIYWKTTTGTGNVIANNLLARNAARGLSLHDNTGVGVYDVLVAHNTVVYNGSQGIKLNQGDRNIIVNNLVAFNGDLNNASQIRIETGSGNNHEVRNNLTYSITASRAGLQNQTTSPMSGNMIADPLLVSATDFHIQAGSPAVGLGLPAFAVSPDYDGTARDAAPDAGAFER